MVEDTLGALLIGVVIAGILYGFVCVQAWYYYALYPSDRWYIKLLVTAVYVSETCHQGMITHAAYTYIIVEFGKFEALQKVAWNLIIAVFFNAFTTLSVQCFLAVRVYKLSNKSWLAAGLVMMFVIAAFLVAIVYAIEALCLGSFVRLTSLKDLLMAINALAAAGDALIAISLCYLLHVSRTGIRDSDTLINKLIVFTVNTGLLTSLCAIASLVSISLQPRAWIYMAFYLCIGRLYCNSLLATLNARKRLRESSEEDLSLSYHCCGSRQKTDQGVINTRVSRRGGVERGLITHQRVPNNISIKVDTTQEYVQDEYSFSNGDSKRPGVVRGRL